MGVVKPREAPPHLTSVRLVAYMGGTHPTPTEEDHVVPPQPDMPAAATTHVASKKDRPGFVEFQRIDGRPRLDDLWFMVGSRCNLTCTHCYLDSTTCSSR